MSEEASDREWEPFMNNALGRSVSEGGLLIDVDPPQRSLAWAPVKRGQAD